MGVTNYMTVNGKIRSEQRSGEAHSRDYVLDRLGSVIQIYQNGWMVADAAYEPYGGIYTQWNMEGKTFTWLGGWGYRQTGVEWSSVYVRARHYSRGLSSWTSVDPLWPSEMAYGYVEGRVMTGVDYWGWSAGHNFWKCMKTFEGEPGSLKVKCESCKRQSCSKVDCSAEMFGCKSQIGSESKRREIIAWIAEKVLRNVGGAVGTLNCAYCATIVIQKGKQCKSICNDEDYVARYYPHCNHNSLCCEKSCREDARCPETDPALHECIQDCIKAGIGGGGGLKGG